MAKKSSNYCCNLCGAEMDKKKDVIEHYHNKHSDGNAYELYEAIGTTGDPYVDRAIKALQQKCFTANDKVDNYDKLNQELTNEVKGVLKAFTETVNNYNKLSKNIHIAKLVLGGCEDTLIQLNQPLLDLKKKYSME